MAAYLVRHAFMVGSDGAAQVSKPGTTLPGVVGGAGTGLLASTGPVGFGVGAGVGEAGGAGLSEGGSQPGGTPVGGAVTTGQAGFLGLLLTWAGALAGWPPMTGCSTMTGFRLMPSGRTVVRICLVEPWSVP